MQLHIKQEEQEHQICGTPQIRGFEFAFTLPLKYCLELAEERVLQLYSPQLVHKDVKINHIKNC